MVSSVQLLGSPHIVRDGAVIGLPRGRKAWGLLPYLVSADRPVARERLAELLFPDADDPMGAVRWNLSELRRALGRDTVRGDPVVLALPADTTVDVRLLRGTSWIEAIDLPGLGEPLLAGLSFASVPGFDAWLASECRHLLGNSEAVLAQAARVRLTRGDASAAAADARRLVELAPFDENAHILLVRSLAASGDLEGAAAHVQACTAAFLSELGTVPSAALRTAAAPVTGVPGRHGPATVVAQLEAGASAIAAGATDAGLDALRRGVVAARASDDPQLLGRALVELGGALVHAARGSDEEGAAALHEAVALDADDIDPWTAARAHRELGWVDFLRGRYAPARMHLAEAAGLSRHDDAELAWVELSEGAVHTDLGHHAAALECLTSAVGRADRTDSRRAAAMALAMLGRLHLLRRELDLARAALTRSIDLARADAWLAFQPFPGALRAEVDLVQGDVDTAAQAFEHAFALGCQVGDPCWESLAARGLGLVAMARGDQTAALELLDDAPRRCRRMPDTYLWIEAYALDARCAVGVAAGAGRVADWVDELDRLASRLGMRELVARAAIHRAHLGVPGAHDAARASCDQVDNPALLAELDAVAALPG